jgi:hypothetical protein
VYGDDIIVPIEHAHRVISDLESVGLKVNESKSFLSGKFRESCGFDGYDGWDVSPTYMRRRLPRNRSEVAEVTSLTSFRNQIWTKHGKCAVTDIIDEHLVRRCGVTYVPSGTDCVGLWLDQDDEHLITLRWNAALQRKEVRALKPVYSYREDSASSDGTLMKSLRLNRGGFDSL